MLAGRYELREEIARGGMGVVHRGDDTLLGRPVAVKEVVPPPALQGPERSSLRQRVLREARAAAGLQHPGVVTVFDVIEEQGRAFIVMELVDAPSLEAVVRSEGPLPPERAAAVGLEAASILRAAHARGVTHRDVKPANVLLTADGHVKLADFGISSINDDPSMTSTGEVIGSPAYMAPEQVRGEHAGPETDLWGLGATLYFAVEGAPPFEREGPAVATLSAVAHDDPRPMRRAGLLAPVISALLQKDAAARPAEDAVPEMLAAAGPSPLGPAAGVTDRTLPAEDRAPTSLLGRASERGGSRTEERPAPTGRRIGPWIALAALLAALALVGFVVASIFVGPDPAASSDNGRQASRSGASGTERASRNDAQRTAPPTSAEPTAVAPIVEEDNSGPGGGNSGPGNSGSASNPDVQSDPEPQGNALGHEDGSGSEDGSGNEGGSSGSGSHIVPVPEPSDSPEASEP
jgi:serine/threonine protein kinase